MNKIGKSEFEDTLELNFRYPLYYFGFIFPLEHSSDIHYHFPHAFANVLRLPSQLNLSSSSLTELTPLLTQPADIFLSDRQTRNKKN